MRTKLKQVLSFLIRCISKVYTYDLVETLKHYRNSLYSLWIKNFIGDCGETSQIVYPCRLWGGGNKQIYIGNNTTIYSDCILGCWIKYAGREYHPQIVIGDNCNVGEHTHISSINKITIGNGLLTGRYVYIGDNSHGDLSLDGCSITPINRELKSKGEIVIGDNVWIGDKVTILSGVHIGNNVIVAANSVLTKNFPSNCVVAGVPAKIIKQL